MMRRRMKNFHGTIKGEPKLKITTALLGLGEVVKKVSDHLEPFHGCWKLSSQLLLSVLYPTFTLQIPNLDLP